MAATRKKKSKYPEEMVLGSSRFQRVINDEPFYWFQSTVKGPDLVGRTDSISFDEKNKVWICSVGRGRGSTPKESYDNAINAMIEEENTRHKLRIELLSKEQELLKKSKD